MSSVTNKATSKDADEIDLGRLIGEFIDYRKLIISVTSLFTLVALIYAIFATPIYRLMRLFRLSRNKQMPYLAILARCFRIANLNRPQKLR